MIVCGIVNPLKGFDLQLTRYDARGWRATFYVTGMEHSPTGAPGTAWEPTPWQAVQGAAWEALRGHGGAMSYTADRPGYWNIMLAYLRAGYDAWRARESGAMGVEIEQRLRLSTSEGIDFMTELEQLGLIRMDEHENAVAAYRLALGGLALMERLPSLEHLLRRQADAIEATPAPVEEKHYATFRLKEEVLKTAISKGADVAIQNAPQIWTGLRDLYRWLPADWKSGS